MANEKLSGLTVDLKLDLDVSETLTGLKAIQREAKKATQAVRELETMYGTDEGRFYVKWNQDEEDTCTDIQTTKLSDIPTKYLQRELSKREDSEVKELLHEKLTALINQRDVINCTYLEDASSKPEFNKIINQIEVIEELIK